MSKKEHKLTPAKLAAWYEMTPEESLAWCESGLSSCEDDLDNLAEDAIIRYGRLLKKKKDEQLEEAEKRVEMLKMKVKEAEAKAARWAAWAAKLEVQMRREGWTQEDLDDLQRE